MYRVGITPPVDQGENRGSANKLGPGRSSRAMAMFHMRDLRRNQRYFGGDIRATKERVGPHPVPPPPPPPFNLVQPSHSGA